MIIKKVNFMSSTNTALVNKQILSNGKIQISPQHMVEFNLHPPKLLR